MRDIKPKDGTVQFLTHFHSFSVTIKFYTQERTLETDHGGRGEINFDLKRSTFLILDKTSYKTLIKLTFFGLLPNILTLTSII